LHVTHAAPVTIDLPPLHAGQEDVFASPARFKVVCAGARWGKNVLGVVTCLAAALQQGGRYWWVAPDYKRAAEGWRVLRELSAPLAGLGVIPREADRIVTFPMTGGEIEIRSADDPDQLRGSGLDGLVLDEAAFVAERTWPEVLRSRLVERRGWALFISTPHGKNWFYDLWESARTWPGWARWQRPSSENPIIPPEELAQARREMGEARYLQEHEAQFLDLATVQPFRPAWFLTYDLLHRPPLDQLWIAIGLDLAASQRDEACQTALVAAGVQIAGEARDGTIYVLHADAGHWSPYETVERLAGLLRTMPVRKLRLERAAHDLVMAHVLARELPIRGLTPPSVETVKHETDKLTRALGVSPLVEAGMILFGPGQERLTAALTAVPRDASAWDLVDAFGLAVTGLPAVRGGRSSIADPVDAPGRAIARSYAAITVDPVLHRPSAFAGAPRLPAGWVPGVAGLVRSGSSRGIAAERARRRAAGYAVKPALVGPRW
jgi:predicted phage terminase large subunit-like protein